MCYKLIYIYGDLDQKLTQAFNSKFIIEKVILKQEGVKILCIYKGKL